MYSSRSSPSPQKSSKLKEMSRQVYEKLERRRRKYKKRQIEYIGWDYPDVETTRVSELVSVITLNNNSKESIQFYNQVHQTAYLQQGSDIDRVMYGVVEKYVKPMVFCHQIPLFMSQTIK